MLKRQKVAEINVGKPIIVCTGTAGTGKSLLARCIAKWVGTYTEVKFDTITGGKFALGDCLQDAPDTLILDDFHANERNLAVLEVLTSNDTIVTERKGMVPVEVKTPNIILCSGGRSHGSARYRRTQIYCNQLVITKTRRMKC